MRRANDFYPTESAVTKVLVEKVSALSMAKTILEPCAGDGAISNIFRNMGIDVTTNDIDLNHSTNYDDCAKVRTNWEKWQEENGAFDWVITNPPFNQAHAILPFAYEYSQVGVAFLLRLSYLEPAQNRGEWLRSHSSKLTNLIILGQPRPSFTGNGGTDSCTVAWMVWRKEPRTDTDTIVDFVTNWKN
ncbi:hypothetical protein [Microcoleus sp. bin38.metabat.b11b12b14.051]|uniref:hypothetical protein n=1 Tax=Microcoleus sp. bin38.metabat.b11b12b14.051 TaxID=2742709 RepID=UPI0025DB22F8|nr:hypothetical protein [Microcoleus sp. bin38.metabat.b11b12b14.051]